MGNILEERIAKHVAFIRNDDEDVGLVIRYKGPQPSATVGVAANGNITLKHGVAGAEAVDTSVGIPTLNGVIVVANAGANTFGKVIDHLNNSANWEVYQLDVLRADSSNDALLPLAATQCHKGLVPEGVRLKKDTAVALNISKAIRFREFPYGFERVEESHIASVFRIISKNTFATGTNTIQIYEIDPVAKTETLVAQFAGGATTVEQDKNFSNQRVDSSPGNYLLVRMIGSVACTGFLNVFGVQK